MEDYINAKLNMIQNQDKNDHIVFNLDDEILNKKFNDTLPKKHGFSLFENPKNMFSADSTKIYDEAYNKLIDLKNIRLPGKHNLSNILAAATAAKILGIPNSKISDTIASFTGVEHRIEKVLNINGVTYYNDSKATNVEAVQVALDSFVNPINLILGGKDKGGKFTSLLPHFKNKVKEIIVYGEAASLIKSALGDAVKLKIVFSLKDAVKTCHTRSKPGDIVLLSPGCASFDQFNNFEERGDVFKSIVKEIAKS
jgi:UDP-N-acetylmuramoylalanine--D-glutamate ligase